MKNLISKITDLLQDATFLRQFHGWATIFWIVMIPISVFTGWVNLTVYVSALSLWALVASHWAAWQASRVEEKEDKK
jgi:hypothetical protein